MIFNSFEFLYFFLVVFSVFFLLPARWQNHFLLAASYFFYGFWSVKYLLLLIFTMLLDYVVALRMDAEERPLQRKLYLIFSLVANLGVLFVFKYLNLFYTLLAPAVLKREVTPLAIILPFGISFYTFHAMSYVIDVYRRQIRAERSFIFYSGYVMFFPQLVAGPIARASHLLKQFKTEKTLKSENLKQGAYLMIRGFLLKVVLADNIAGFVNSIFLFEYPKPFLVAQAVYFFAFQIYFDFSGYTDIARGVAKIFDFDLVINFNRPYVATSVTDFWRRWHISLSTWLRDYLYISLGGNRRGRLLTYRNLMFTMLLGGLWHGASLTFVAWGALHGFYLGLEKLFSETKIIVAYRKLPRALRIFVTFQLVSFAWIFFRCANFNEAGIVLRQFGFFVRHPSAPRLEFQTSLWGMTFLWMVFEWLEERLSLFEKYMAAGWKTRSAFYYGAIASIALFAEVNPKAFIYFQF